MQQGNGGSPHDRAASIQVRSRSVSKGESRCSAHIPKTTRALHQDKESRQATEGGEVGED
ncbi:hypothetical protein [Moorena sp. SIOASIH]|uniref:hypothetical protein n=1 Tax=Moorena sp. SIOASIH TaxID=2607817 RepID=UPI002600AC05|nr:hypothetical protein [Moorena sp. SIOASIH]